MTSLFFLVVTIFLFSGTCFGQKKGKSVGGASSLLKYGQKVLKDNYGEVESIQGVRSEDGKIEIDFRDKIMSDTVVSSDLFHNTPPMDMKWTLNITVRVIGKAVMDTVAGVFECILDTLNALWCPSCGLKNGDLSGLEVSDFSASKDFLTYPCEDSLQLFEFPFGNVLGKLQSKELILVVDAVGAVVVSGGYKVVSEYGFVHVSGSDRHPSGWVLAMSNNQSQENYLAKNPYISNHYDVWLYDPVKRLEKMSKGTHKKK